MKPAPMVALPSSPEWMLRRWRWLRASFSQVAVDHALGGGDRVAPTHHGFPKRGMAGDKQQFLTTRTRRSQQLGSTASGK